MSPEQPTNAKSLEEAFVGDFNRSAELYERVQTPFSDLVSRELVRLARVSTGRDVPHN